MTMKKIYEIINGKEEIKEIIQQIKMMLVNDTAMSMTTAKKINDKLNQILKILG